MTQAFIRAQAPEIIEQRTRAAVGWLRLTLLVGLLGMLLIPGLARAAAEDEREALAAAWPGEQAPFNEWTPPEILLRDGRLEFSLRHRESGEGVILLVSARGEGSAYARTDRYTLSYTKPPGAGEGVASPELERLLGAWVEWLDRVEGEHSALADAGTVERLRRERQEREEAARLEAEAAERREREAAYAQGERPIPPRPPLSVNRLVYGNSGPPSGFRDTVIPLYLALLVALVLLGMLPRLNAMHDALLPEVESWIRRTGFWFLAPLSFGYGLTLALTLSPEAWAGRAPLPVGDMLGLLVHPLAEFVAHAGISPGVLTVLLGGGLMFLATLVCTVAVYALFWRRDVAACAGVLYFLFRLLTVPGGDLFSPLLLDISLGLFFFGLVQHAWGMSDSRRILLCVPSFALAVFLDLSFLVLPVLFFAYLLAESRDRQRTFRYPLVWIVPLWMLVAALPVFFVLPFSDGGALLWRVFVSGWGLGDEGLSFTGWRVDVGLHALWLLAGLGLLVHFPAWRAMTLGLGFFWLLLLLFRMGLAPEILPSEPGGSLLFPVILGAVGLMSLIKRREREG